MSLSPVALCCSVILTVAAALPAGALELEPVLERARTSSDATVILVPPMALYRFALDEAALQRAGCRYRTRDPAAVRALVGLLAVSGLREGVVYKRPDAREAVYIKTPDGELLKFLFADNAGAHVPVDGTVEASTSGSIQSGAVVGGERLAVELRRWTAANGGVGTGASCDRQSGITTAP